MHRECVLLGLTSLLPEHQACCTCAVVSSVEVDGTHAVPVLDLIIETSSFRRNARICNHNVQTSKILHDLSHGLLYRRIILYCHLVCFDFDIVVCRDGCSERFGVLGRIVPDRNLSKDISNESGRYDGIDQRWLQLPRGLVQSRSRYLLHHL